MDQKLLQIGDYLYRLSYHDTIALQRITRVTSTTAVGQFGTIFSRKIYGDDTVSERGRRYYWHIPTPEKLAEIQADNARKELIYKIRQLVNSGKLDTISSPNLTTIIEMLEPKCNQ
jgi:hypothetical protein